MPTVQDTTSFGETQWLHNVTGSTRPGDTCVFDLGDGRVLRRWRGRRNPVADVIPGCDDDFNGVCNAAFHMIRDIGDTELVPPTLIDASCATAPGPKGKPQKVFSTTPPAGVEASVMATGIVDDGMLEVFFVQDEASSAAACALGARTWSLPSRGLTTGYDICARRKGALSRGAGGCGLPVRTGSC